MRLSQCRLFMMLLHTLTVPQAMRATCCVPKLPSAFACRLVVYQCMHGVKWRCTESRLVQWVRRLAEGAKAGQPGCAGPSATHPHVWRGAVLTSKVLTWKMCMLDS